MITHLRAPVTIKPPFDPRANRLFHALSLGVAHAYRVELSPIATQRTDLRRTALPGSCAHHSGSLAASHSAICLSNSTIFPVVVYSNKTKPVALPPGRASFRQNSATGSTTLTNTTGMVGLVCCTAASAKYRSPASRLARARPVPPRICGVLSDRWHSIDNQSHVAADGPAHFCKPCAHGVAGLAADRLRRWTSVRR